MFNDKFFLSYLMINKGEHITNSKAMQVALQSSWMCKTEIGDLLTTREIDKQLKYKFQLDQALEKLNELEKGARVYSQLFNSLISIRDEDGSQIVINKENIEKISSPRIKNLLTTTLNFKGEAITDEAEEPAIPIDLDI